jgi:hypothetical protein
VVLKKGVGVRIQEKLDELVLTRNDGQDNRRLAAVVLCVHVGAVGEHCADRAGVARADSLME